MDCCTGAGCCGGEGPSQLAPVEAATSCEGHKGAAAHGFVPAAAVSRVLPKVPVIQCCVLWKVPGQLR